jgi:hypothetical protein
MILQVEPYPTPRQTGVLHDPQGWVEAFMKAGMVSGSFTFVRPESFFYESAAPNVEGGKRPPLTPKRFHRFLRIFQHASIHSETHPARRRAP